MRFIRSVLLCALFIAGAASAQTGAQYPPLSDYLMTRDAELALVRTAAPPNVVDHATIELLDKTGYRVASEGDNGFVCLVLRGWSAPTFTPTQFRAFVYDASIRAPICYNPIAARTVLPYQKLRARLGMEGKTPDEIAAGIQAAYATGKLPKMDAGTVGFAYMFSAEQNLGPGIGAFHPHVMVFAPYNDNALLGNNAFGGPYPFLSDDTGTPFAVTVIPIDHDAAIRFRR